MSSLKYLMNVEGKSGRFNNLIYVPGRRKINQFIWQIVCYFGGDIQNFHDKMIKQNNDQEFLQYSLENVATKLSQRFNDEHDILVVQPSQTINSFSLYKNFVNSTKPYGTPSFDDNNRCCFDHFQQLLMNVAKQIKLNVDTIEVCLIGFSKGQIVINQMARSIHLISTEQSIKLKFNNLYLLDGGHNGVKDFWITQPELIESFIRHGCRNFHLGVTDFQLNKPQNIRQEFEIFHQILCSKPDVNVKKTYLAQCDFPDLQPINLHFKLLDLLFQNLL
ncbi:hypothetical protein DERP_000654 [Dermatophagoides pteronyssinus]|uniref:Uncharacterized protein n=1 Tax=Dermatophagoides pteronyssinus TaxID=6956 RepID=A0ABQ8J0Y4_DERPT|nr:hypothetical protein DERP_000654 [Dermatophagoides pteronyssinus]